MRTLYVISDLHLGGAAPGSQEAHGSRGFRICTNESGLAAFIRSLANPSELVLNGDTFDFLAEQASTNKPQWSAFRADQSSALATLNAIAKRSAVAEVLKALNEYAAKGN